MKDVDFFQTSLNKKATRPDDSTGKNYEEIRPIFKDVDEAFSLKEWHRALTLLAFIEIAFFGTGNLFL